MASGNLLRQMTGQLVGAAPEQARWSPTTLTPQQQAVLAKLVSQLGSEGITGPAYEGELTAGLGDLEGLSLDAIEKKILQQATGEGVSGDASTALSDLIKRGGAPTNFEDYFRSSVSAPLEQEFRESILPELTRRYGSSGAFGSDRKLAEQQATERLVQTLAGARGELAFKTQESASDRLLKAIGLAPGLETAGVDDILKLLQGAGLPRQIEQAKLTSQYGEFQRQQSDRNTRIQQILAALGIKGVENIATGLPGQRGELGMQAEATTKAAGSALGGILSDRRLKSDIVLMTPLPSGLNLYSFRYKYDPRLLHYGVMADEVEAIMPEAIILRDDGMKLVDYTMLSEHGML